MENNVIQTVRDVLQKFQDGYVKRDISLLDSFQKLFVAESELEVIGTGATTPGDYEWCLGPGAAIQLVKNDWEGWGDLRLDVPGARIFTLGNVAWLATSGTVEMKVPQVETYQEYMDYLPSVLRDESTSARDRLIEILRGATNTLYEAERGDQYVWPIRFTAVLVQQEGNWLFHQMQFSFPTTRFPDVRK